MRAIKCQRGTTSASICLLIIIFFIFSSMFIVRVKPVFKFSFSLCIGVLLHSVSSNDVIAVRSQLAIDRMSNELNWARDSYCRRRRDRAIFEHVRPETDEKTNEPDWSRKMPNTAADDYTNKQELTNQNGKVTTDHAHTRNTTRHSSCRYYRKLPLSLFISERNDDTTKPAPPASDDRPRVKRRSNSFNSFFKRMTLFRLTSPKCESGVKATGYRTRTGDGRDSVTVSRRESSTDRDVTAASRRADDSRLTSQRHDVMMTSRRHDASTLSRRHTSVLPTDVTATRSRSHGLVRHASDNSLATSSGNGVLASPAGYGESVTSLRRHNSLMPTPTTRDSFANKSSTILKMAGLSSSKRSHELVRHESLSRNGDMVAPRSHDMVRHKSQSTAMKSGFGKEAYTKAQRSDTARASQWNNYLVRHGSLPEITTSRNDRVVFSQLPSRDMVRASPESRDSQPTKTQSRRHKFEPRHDATVWPRSHQLTLTTSYHDDVKKLSRRHNSERLVMASKNTGRTNCRPCGLEDSTEPQNVEPTEQRINSSTLRSATQGHVRGKSPPVPTSSRTPLSVKRHQTSVHLTSTSEHQQGASQLLEPSQSSSKAEDQVPSQPVPVTKPYVLSSSEENQVRLHSIRPVPAPRQRASQVSPSPPPPSLSLQLPSSSSKSEDEVKIKPAVMSKPYVLSSLEQIQTSSDAIQPIPKPRKKRDRIPPSPTPSSSSSTRRSLSKPSAERYETRPISVDGNQSSLLQRSTDQIPQPLDSVSSSTPEKNITSIIIQQDTSPTATDFHYSLPTYQDGGQESPDELMDELSKSRSSLETANVVIVRPLPTLGQLTPVLNDYDGTKCVSGRLNSGEAVANETVTRQRGCVTPTATITGSDDDDDMRSGRNTVSGGNGMKSALRKTSRSHSCDRHVSYSSTDTVYRSVSLTINLFIYLFLFK